ncbi:MAG TPA: S4 domain-containing protein, partial [Caulobacteraceae bacterium]|nr:S4 domain-containing protein [Caulobacteraceae bacterium]
MVRHPRDSAPRKGSGQAEKSGSRPRSDSKARSGPKPAGAKTEAGAKPQPRPERIAKALARAGIASRREVERLINLGKVAVNGRLLDSPAVLVTRDDIVT